MSLVPDNLVLGYSTTRGLFDPQELYDLKPAYCDAVFLAIDRLRGVLKGLW